MYVLKILEYKDFTYLSNEYFREISKKYQTMYEYFFIRKIFSLKKDSKPDLENL